MKKLKPEFKIAEKFLVQQQEQSPVVEYLESQLELREMPVEEQAKRFLKERKF